MDSALQLMSAYDLAEITLEQLTHASGVRCHGVFNASEEGLWIRRDGVATRVEVSPAPRFS